MLSLWKLRVGAEAYYLSQVARGIDDYYSGAGESTGRWLGTGADILNLPEAVTGDDLRAILAGLAPGTGLSPNGTQIRPFKNRVPGFDLTFSAPKSVSVMYAFADPIVRADITAAVDNAVAESLAWLEREACFVRRGSNNKRAKTPAFEKWGTRRLAGAGFIAAGFRHRTSRAGDPQLHTHVLVANLTRGPDGKWSALDGQALYRSKLAAGVVFQTALRNELTVRLGVRWRPAHEHVADIAGIPQRVLTHFSKRRNEIEDELERTGQSGPAAAAHATLATRTAKVEIDHETLDQRWADDGSTIGFGSDDINRLLRGNQPRTAVRDLTADSKLAMREIDPITGEVREVIVSIDQFASIVAHGLPERNATVTRLDVQNAIADHLLGNGDSAFLERLTDAVLADPELVLIPPPDNADQTGWEQLWTTRRMLRIEADIRSIVTPISQPRHSLPAVSVEQSLAAVGQALGPDQADTVRRLCTQGLDVEVVVGRAGTGKTYTMNAVRQVLDTHGKRLLGVCPTARAARELADGAHIDTFTIPRLFSQTNLTSNDVLVVDEAGMCGTLDLHRLLLHARERGTQVILVGDHRQLPEVTAGGGFAAALDAVGVRRCELTVNRRQIQTWEHAALDHLRDGDVTTFWHTFNDNGRVHLEANREALHANAIDAWWRDHTAGHDAHLIAGTRSEARLLNRMARERAAAADQLTGPELAIRDRSFQVGDRIVLLSNDANQTDRTTGQRSRVDNGMIATVIQIDHRTGALDVQVASTDQRIGLTPDYVHSGSIDHGYATTIHKAQGVTCDHIHVVGPAGLYREAAYVALSRARRSAHLYATTDEAATIGERGHTTGIPLASENLDDPEADLTRAISTSRAKRFVTADHPSLAHIADLASRCDLGELRRRRRRVLAVITQLEAQGVDDPRQEAERHRLATEHRQHMHVGERVNARDWDNVGTVQRLHDLTGQASVRFVSGTGKATVRLLPWHQLKPIDHPDETPLTDLAQRHLDEAAERVGLTVAARNAALEAVGIGPNESSLLDSAITQRAEQVTRRLRATPPDWLTWWTGTRPPDPTAAVVYDDHLRELATWRDEHQIAADVAGFGPPPTDPALLDAWRTLTDRALATRRFLHEHETVANTPRRLGPDEIQSRLQELDELIATAPPDQQHLLDRILTGVDEAITDVVAALDAANSQQQERRDWILEHWPHIVEHHELTRLAGNQDLLAHWPRPIDPAVLDILDTIAEAHADHEPEMTTIEELQRLSSVDTTDDELRRMERELDEIHGALKDLPTKTSCATTSTSLLEQHRHRLVERRSELRAACTHLEARSALDGWKPSERSEESDRRLDQLVHEAATQRSAWIVDAVKRSLEDDDAVYGPALVDSIRHEARRRAAGPSIASLAIDEPTLT